MKLITFTLMLSLLAFAALRQADAQEDSWNKYVKCARVGTKAVAAVLRESVPVFRTYLTCIDFTPPVNFLDTPRSYLSYIKVVYELLKRSIFEKSECLLTPLRNSITFLKPQVNQIDNLKCFDE